MGRSLDPKLRKRLHEEQDGKCAGCDGEATDAAHLVALGAGRDRSDRSDPLNSAENIVLLCRRCHELQEALRRKRHAAWRDGEEDYRGA